VAAAAAAETYIKPTVVPPGHYLPGIFGEGSRDDATVQPCPVGDLELGEAGGYQPGWLKARDAASSACVPCGANIMANAHQQLRVYRLQDDGVVRQDYVKVALSKASCCE
jgi:hypothetical protein